ncbi:hypothetical protein [Mycobacterium sp. pR1184]|uniref:hypothetical protein n=1 Tax=Mycobacterium sp. pR1184 TaxID=3238981 RepID=UPI00351BD327
MVRAPADSESIRAEVAELVGIGVDAVQHACNPRCRGLGSLRVTSPAGSSRRVAAGSQAHSAIALGNAAHGSGEHHDVP